MINILCGGLKQTTSNNLDLLVSEYIDIYGDSYTNEDDWWRDEKLTWDEAIERAWISRLKNGKMHGHQRRVAKYLPDGITIALADQKHKEEFNSFNNLYVWIKSITDRIKGLGSTTAYDVARRLGVWLGLEPVFVYLHAGASVGATKFCIQGDIVSLSAFPKEIQCLSATHVENFLCIYKNHIDFPYPELTLNWKNTQV
jgi:hypothetical protein